MDARRCSADVHMQEGVVCGCKKVLRECMREGVVLMCRCKKVYIACVYVRRYSMCVSKKL